MRQVCGLEVHKDSVFVCILNEKGVVFQEKFGALTPELEQLAAALQEHDVSEVCMESISIYWMTWWVVMMTGESLRMTEEKRAWIPDQVRMTGPYGYCENAHSLSISYEWHAYSRHRGMETVR